MKGRLRKRTVADWINQVTAEPPDADQYVPQGRIRLEVRAGISGGNGSFELVALAGHPVYPTLIGVESRTIETDEGEEILGTVHWATPEAIARSAEIYADKIARGEVPDPRAAAG